MSDPNPSPPQAPRGLRQRAAARVQGLVGRERYARWRPWFPVVATFLLAVVAAVTLWGKMRSDVWAYFTDGETIRLSPDDAKARPVLWQDPEPQFFGAPDAKPAQQQGVQVEAAFSGDGTMMVLVREGDAATKADMFLSQWDGRVWSQPEPIPSINTPANERGPALSHDGRYLYFASDREGGKGGYDLFVARWNGSEWTAVEPLPPAVNTASDELGPALSADGSQLYFSSNRDGGADDIFVAKVSLDPKPEQPDQVAPAPSFADAAPVDNLNSKAADVQAALTARGDHVFLASDRDRTKKSGFKVYIGRVIDGEALPPEEVDLYIKEGDVTDPAVRMDGFDLLFSSDSGDGAAAGQEPGYRLYHSTTREVTAYTDLTRWEQFKELMGNVAWWILLAIAAFIALIYLLEKWRDITSLFHKCLAGSAALHLLWLLLAMLWLIAKEIDHSEEEKYAEVEISIDALTEEELAMESIPQETQLTDTTTDVQSEKMEAEFGAPGFEAQDEQAVPDASKTAKESLLVEVQPAMSDTADQPVPEPPQDSSILNDLAATTLPAIDTPLLEVRDTAQPQEVADTTDDQFAPEPPTTDTAKTEPAEMSDNAVETPVEAVEVTEFHQQEPLVDSPKQSSVEVAAAQADAELPTEQPPLDSEVLNELPEMAFAEPDTAPLEEVDPSNPQTPDAPANPAEDTFTPEQAMQGVASAQAQSESIADNSVNDSADASAVAEGETVASAAAIDSATGEVGESSPSEALPPADFAPGTPAGGLPEFVIADPGVPKLEEPAGQPAAAPADTSSDLFNPEQGSPNLATAQAESQTIADASVTAAAQASAVSPAATVAESAAAEIRPPVIETGGAPNTLPPSDLDPAPMSALPDPTLPDPGAPRLEEIGGAPAGGAPADTSKDQFTPAGGVPNLSTAKAASQTIADASVTAAAQASAITPAAIVAGSPVVEARPPEALTGGSPNTVPPANLDPAPMGALPEPQLVDPGGPKLEEPGQPAGGAPADTSKDQFNPTGSAPNLSTAPAADKAIPDAAAAGQSDAAAVASGARVPASTAVEARPPEAGGSAAPDTVPPADPGAGTLSALPDLAPLDPGAPKLEEPGNNPGAPANPGDDLFKPGGSVPNLATAQSGGRMVADAAVANAAGNAEVAAASTAAGGSASASPTSLEAAGGVPDLNLGSGVSGLTDAALPNPGLPGKLEAPEGGDPRAIANIIQKTRGKPGIDTIKQMGGSDGTEGAIGAAMEWFSKNQESDGRWDSQKHGAKKNHDLGGTGLALLCFYGWGERHDIACKYQQNVRKALDWLLSKQGADGYLGGGPGMMYSHAIATIAICEAYGVTKDPRLKEPAERAIAYTLAAQSPTRGGWRYSPGNDSDTSVTGWQYMALHSARMAGIAAPDAAFAKARKFLDDMGGGKFGGLYGYQQRGNLSRAMVATGMFCRQLDLVAPSNPMQQESARLLKMHPMKTSNPDLYYVYYATLALYQHQGPVWQAWNEQLKVTLPLIQKKTGGQAGSWDPSSSMTSEGGRVVSTALSTLSLEVYYRLLPMYGFRNEETDAPEKKERDG